MGFRFVVVAINETGKGIHNLMNFENFAEECRKYGLTAHKCSDIHWQIRGGKLLVNYYPTSGTHYIAGTTGKHVGSPYKAMQAANAVPVIQGKQRKEPQKQLTKYKKKLWKRSEVCYWCKGQLVRDTATVDHVVPRSRGGLTNFNNLVLACHECNQKRGNQMPELKGEHHV